MPLSGRDSWKNRTQRQRQRYAVKGKTRLRQGCGGLRTRKWIALFIVLPPGHRPGCRPGSAVEFHERFLEAAAADLDAPGMAGKAGKKWREGLRRHPEQDRMTCVPVAVSCEHTGQRAECCRVALRERRSPRSVRRGAARALISGRGAVGDELSPGDQHDPVGVGIRLLRGSGSRRRRSCPASAISRIDCQEVAWRPSTSMPAVGLVEQEQVGVADQRGREPGPAGSGRRTASWSTARQRRPAPVSLSTSLSTSSGAG